MNHFFLLTVLGWLNRIINLYSYVLVAYALLSWFPNGQGTRLAYWIRRLSRPYLEIFDRLIPSLGGISFSVVAGILFLQLVQRGLIVIFSFLLSTFNR